VHKTSLKHTHHPQLERAVGRKQNKKLKTFFIC